MGRVRRRVRHEAGAVEVDAVEVLEVRILAGVHPAGHEVDLARDRIDALDAAHKPLALGDLVLHAPGRAVVQVQVVPAITFGHPDDLAPIADLRPESLGRVLEERRHPLVYHRPCARGRGVDLDDPEHLVAALVVLERHRAPIAPPHEGRHVVRVGEERLVDDQLLTRGDDRTGPAAPRRARRRACDRAASSAWAGADPPATIRCSGPRAGTRASPGTRRASGNRATTRSTAANRHRPRCPRR